jgi:hypothetical protein
LDGHFYIALWYAQKAIQAGKIRSGLKELKVLFRQKPLRTSKMVARFLLTPNSDRFGKGQSRKFPDAVFNPIGAGPGGVADMKGGQQQDVL